MYKQHIKAWGGVEVRSNALFSLDAGKVLASRSNLS